MPVFEEDEEDCDSPGEEEEEDATEDTQTEVRPCSQTPVYECLHYRKSIPMKCLLFFVFLTDTD